MIELLQPISLPDYPWWVQSGIKGGVAIMLVGIWILLISKMKRKLVNL